jgi:hypothetical protein
MGKPVKTIRLDRHDHDAVVITDMRNAFLPPLSYRCGLRDAAPSGAGATPADAMRNLAERLRELADRIDEHARQLAIEALRAAEEIPH